MGTNDSFDRLYERVLVLRCQTGDAAAFEELVGMYSARLRNFLRSLIGDLHAADDALQDVWLDVFRCIGRLQDSGAFVTWLYRISRDRAYRVLRRRGLTTRPLEGTELPEPPGDREVEAEELDLLNSSLEALPVEQREVVLLRFVERMPYEQIADAVGCGIGTVRSRLHYAKRALRREIERSLGHD